MESLGSNHTPEQLNFDLKRKKRGLNRIADLRKIWSEGVFSKEVRILTEVFLKKHSLQWIFNSRLENLKFPIKYRRRMLDGVRNPVDFFYLKDYWLEIFDILSFLQNWNHVINSSSQKNIFYIKKINILIQWNRTHANHYCLCCLYALNRRKKKYLKLKNMVLFSLFHFYCF